MHKNEKIETVQELSTQFAKVKAAIVAEYRGLSVEQMTSLRKKVKGASASFRVTKNRLAKLALTTEALKAGLTPHLIGPTGIATSESDVVMLAKALVDFAKDNELFKIKGGMVEGKSVNAKGLEALAKLPSREEMLSMLLSVMQGPARGVVTTLSAVSRGLVTAIKAIGEKKSS